MGSEGTGRLGHGTVGMPKGQSNTGWSKLVLTKGTADARVPRMQADDQ